MSFEEALPTFISTDVFGRHRRKYKQLMREVSAQLRLHAFGATPRGDALQLDVLPEASSPSDRLTTVAGEPYHNVISLRAHGLVCPRANVV